MKIAILVIAAVLLGGCLIVSDREIRQRSLARDAQQCHAYGFEQGTMAYAQCRQSLGQNRRAAGQAALANWYGVSSQRRSADYRTQMEAISSIAKQSQVPVVAPALRRPLNCTTSHAGSYAYTTCY